MQVLYQVSLFRQCTYNNTTSKWMACHFCAWQNQHFYLKVDTLFIFKKLIKFLCPCVAIIFSKLGREQHIFLIRNSQSFIFFKMRKSSRKQRGKIQNTIFTMIFLKIMGMNFLLHKIKEKELQKRCVILYPIFLHTPATIMSCIFEIKQIKGISNSILFSA